MTKSNSNITFNELSKIQKKIFTIRGEQVMLDSDLAIFYNVETRRLNEQVKRNISRFPEEFMFRLTKKEYENLISQIAISTSEHGGRRKIPYVFTEQGVAMLSAVLKSETAVKISIQIMSAFVSMRKFLINNAQLFEKIETVEKRQYSFQLETNQKFEKVFNALQSKELEPKQGIFYDGQIFDAYKFVSGIIRKAEQSIILIDNYIDETVLDLFSKKKENVFVTILTKKLSNAILLDIEKFNSQYPTVKASEFKKSHDRFLIIDHKDFYHFGASLKDLGKKWFAFQKLDSGTFALLENIRKVTMD